MHSRPSFCPRAVHRSHRARGSGRRKNTDGRRTRQHRRPRQARRLWCRVSRHQELCHCYRKRGTRCYSCNTSGQFGEKRAYLRTRRSRGTDERDDMSTPGSRYNTRRTLTSVAVISALFFGTVSMAGCQNGTTAQQFSTEVSSSAPAPMPDPTPLATTPPVVVTSAQTPPPMAPPAPPQRKTSSIAAAAPPSAGSAQESASCDADHYRNSDGNCVHQPQQAASAPPGATARCADGNYSFSQHRKGTCSGHGGVAQWL